MKIYVGNLSHDVTETDLREALAQFGQVESVTIVKDKESGQSKGFGFVQMSSTAQALQVIDGLSGKELKGQALNVNTARSRNENRGNKGEFVGGKGWQSDNRGGYHSVNRGPGGDGTRYTGGRGGQGRGR